MDSKENNARPQSQLRKGDALIVVDLQNDFLPPKGSLAVQQGTEVIYPINRAISVFQNQRLPIYATRDWHPAEHCSFKEQGGPWPPHCVAETFGAAFSQDLRLPHDAIVISKATRREEDAYSGFQGTDLREKLKAAQVSRLFVVGLATDYCVLNTVKDALRHGFEVYVLEDGIRAVNVNPKDDDNAKAEMKKLGATFSLAENLS